MKAPNTDTIRSTIRQQRRNLTPSQRHDCAFGLLEQLKRQKSFINSRNIACYIPVQGEISPIPLIELSLQMGKAVYLPVLMPFLSNRLWFAPYKFDSHMKMNKFGIPEPVFSRRELIPANQLDLVITPLVAFDEQCNRIGMGGGYYDRTFSFLRFRKHWISPKLIGIAYEFQKIALIKKQKWDVELHSVCTEQFYYS